jgi:hypothetical protein
MLREIDIQTNKPVHQVCSAVRLLQGGYVEEHQPQFLSLGIFFPHKEVLKCF